MYNQSEMDKRYNHRVHEEKIYSFWEKSGYFTPRIDTTRRPFVIVMPPPNVTGQLHIGHALTASIEDVLVRWRRMQGIPALYLTGVDHAGIATQNVVEKDLAKEGKTRNDLGREKFIQRVWEWVEKYGHIIDEQHKKLGVSVDWTRRRFTMDSEYQEAVKEAFRRLQKKGLIYKDKRLINWCSRCSTAISDLENIHKDEKGVLYFLEYGGVKIATTRPETIFADIAVAVNPRDKRHKNLVGQKAYIPLMGKEIPIIADGLVDKNFGTGALKITPAHDELDYEIWQKHKAGQKAKSPPPQAGKKQNEEGVPVVITPDGRMAKNEYVPEKYQGMLVVQARKAILDDLRAAGLLVKEESIVHSIGHCQRCNTVIEPMISDQWFVKTEPLAKPAIKAVRDGTIKILPKRFEKTYFHWMEDIKDWCISRQIWWGHKIPIEGEGDVLDTWFSSSLWPFATLGWPKKTEDFKYFYPTTLLETGYDILFFWVARMIMMGYAMTGKAPFKTVYLHGLVRDIRGRKMSKSLGNVIDPVDYIEKYGADALRMALVVGTTPGNDSKISEEKVIGYRNFANKVWNISRFVLSHNPEIKNQKSLAAGRQAKIKNKDDRWILDELKETINLVTQHLNNDRLSPAGEEIYDFIWHKFADVYIEKTKSRREEAQPTLLYVLAQSLKLLHPFMPFVTEVIWQQARKKYEKSGLFGEKALIVASWPVG